MHTPLIAINVEQIVRIGLFVIGLMIAWMVLKTLLRITMRVFTFGCGAILVLGLILLAMRWLGKY